MRQLLLSLLFAIQLHLAVGDKYGCIFDCYLFGAGSAQGYMEYSCNPLIDTAAQCCNYQKCLAAASTAYGGQICPTALVAQTSPPGGGFAKYAVTTNADAKAQFPRQTSSSF